MFRRSSEDGARPMLLRKIRTLERDLAVEQARVEELRGQVKRLEERPAPPPQVYEPRNEASGLLERVPNMEQWGAQLEAEADASSEDEDEEEESGLLDRIGEFYGDALSDDQIRERHELWQKEQV